MSDTTPFGYEPVDEEFDPTDDRVELCFIREDDGDGILLRQSGTAFIKSVDPVDLEAMR